LREAIAMPVIRFEDAPRTENVQGRHVRHCSRMLGSDEILMGRTTKDPGPCAPYIHKHDHEDVIVMLRGSFTLRVGDEDVTIREGDTLIIPPNTVHTPLAAGPEGCELIGMSVADIRSFQPDGAEIGVGFESLRPYGGCRPAWPVVIGRSPTRLWGD
jgi:quercetin dioxygenase-like cupin family protein